MNMACLCNVHVCLMFIDQSKMAAVRLHRLSVAVLILFIVFSFTRANPTWTKGSMHVLCCYYWHISLSLSNYIKD